jgi:hypothetical protein
MATQRETAAQKRTRISMLLADYDARSKELRKLHKIVEGLKEQVREIAPGAYGDWELSEGTPREVLDQAAVRKLYAEQGLQLPVTMTKPSMIVKPKAGR